MINPLERYIIELLQGNIIINDAPVYVYSSFQYNPARPLITLDMGAGATTDMVRRDIKEAETVLYFRNTSININIWADTVTEREQVAEQVMQCFYNEQNNHYKYCTNYSKQNQQCSNTGSTCPAVNGTGTNTIKKKCPDPDRHQYQNLHIKHGIIHGGLNFEPPYYLVDNADRPPIYRAVIRADAEYIEKVPLNGIKNAGANVDIEIL